MRISSFQIHNQASQQLQTLGAQTAATQQQISYGKKLVAPSDDPIGASRVIQINQEVAARAQYVKNAEAADVQLALEDAILDQMTDLLQRVQELTLQAGSGVQTLADRQFIASEIEARFEELVGLANSQNPAGQYLFSGFQADEAPFRAVGNDVIYTGDEGQRNVQVDRGQYVTLNDSGAALFMDLSVPNARFEATSVPESLEVNSVQIADQTLVDDFFPDDVVVEFNEVSGSMTYTVRRASDNRPLEGLANIPFTGNASISAAGVSFRVEGTPLDGDSLVLSSSRQQSVFSTVKQIADGLNQVDAATQPDAFRTLIDNTIAGLESATTNILRTRADIGARFNTINAAKDLHEDIGLQLETVRSEIEDLDFAAAISDLAYQSFVLEAAQQSFVRINGLSLFNRL